MKVEVVKQRNEEFQKMSLTEKRLAVVRDVRKYVLGKYIVPSSNYFYDNSCSPYTTEICTLLVEGEENCHICGIGSLFMGLVGWKDQFTIGMRPDEDTEITYLEELWSPLELRLIEYAFECYFPSYDLDSCEFKDTVNVVDIVQQVSEWMNAVLQEEDRLLSILDVMEANEGRFVVGYTIGELDTKIQECDYIDEEDDEDDN